MISKKLNPKCSRMNCYHPRVRYGALDPKSTKNKVDVGFIRAVLSLLTRWLLRSGSPILSFGIRAVLAPPHAGMKRAA